LENPPRYPFHLCQPDPAKSCGACCGLSRFDKILLSLSSEFGSREDIQEAESIIEEKIKKCLAAYQNEYS
jgi:hypothetical protein